MSLLADVLDDADVLPASHALPRINLLPPEIAERRHFRRVQTGLGAVLLASVGAVAMLHVSALGGAADARQELQTAQAEEAGAQAAVARYADVEAVHARADAAQTMLTQAMGEEVRYGHLMDALAFTVPDGVWLKNVSFTQAPVTPGVGDVEPGIGTVTFTGSAYQHRDVAAWLESLATQKGYTRPYLTSSTEALLGDRVTVDFVSTATVTQAALSRRYTTPGGASS